LEPLRNASLLGCGAGSAGGAGAGRDGLGRDLVGGESDGKRVDRGDSFCFSFSLPFSFSLSAFLPRVKAHARLGRGLTGLFFSLPAGSNFFNRTSSFSLSESSIALFRGDTAFSFNATSSGGLDRL
jgi:hypothetical protein